MDSSLKQRLVGAVVLIALAVIFLPMLVKGPAPDSGVSDVPLDMPAEPKASGESRDLPLTAPGDVPEGGALGMPGTAPDVAGDSPAQGGLFPAVAAGDYAVSFGSYATDTDADKVIAALRSAELPAYREATTISGKSVQRVRIGPFADRAVAESARLRAAHVNDAVGANVIALNADAAPVAAPASPSIAAAAPTPAPAKVEPLPAPKPVAAAPTPSKPVTEPKPAVTTAPAPKPVAKTEAKPEPKPEPKPVDTSGTGFVVQVGAFADAAAATALRDKLRSAGFNAFTDSVNTDAGKRTRVRVGPAMNRAEADVLKAQVKSRAGVDGFVRPHP